jgi:hypothetical protein
MQVHSLSNGLLAQKLAVWHPPGDWNEFWFIFDGHV